MAKCDNLADENNHYKLKPDSMKKKIIIQMKLIGLVERGSWWAKKLLFLYAQKHPLADEPVKALVRLSNKGVTAADDILSAHRYRYEHSRKTDDDLMEYLGRSFWLAAQICSAIWSLD